MSPTIESKNMPIYRLLFFINIIYRIIKKIKHLIIELLSIVKYFAKLVLYSLISLLKKYTPLKIKIKLRYKLLFYPKIKNLTKHFYLWMQTTPNDKKIIFIDYILILLIRLFFLKILKIIINNKNWQLITLQQLKKLPQLRKKVKLLLNLKIITDNPQKNIFHYNIDENSDLSPTALCIYNDLHRHCTKTKSD